MEATPSSEDQRVESWRIEQFTRMGFLPWQAALLAAWSVDWHLAEKVMSGGCKPELALTILEPAY